MRWNRHTVQTFLEVRIHVLNRNAGKCIPLLAPGFRPLVDIVASCNGSVSTPQLCMLSTILVEKTDRLYRNLTDYATVDELGVTIHLVKENQIIGPDSKSSEQFVHGIKVLMARNYSQNLGEETVKGMTEKARAGIYPSFAPVGYQNVDGPNGKRIIVPDPETAPVVREVFERFARENTR